MNYPPPKSGSNGGPGGTPGHDGPTDLHSLLEQEAADLAAAELAEEHVPESQRRRNAKREATDFQSLKDSVASNDPRYVPRGWTDYLIDGLAPCMIWIMVTSFLFLLLEVRYVWTEVNDFELRIIAISFILGVVAINRLVARDGKDESIKWMLAFGVVVFIATLLFTTAYDTGAVMPTNTGVMNRRIANFLSNPKVAAIINLIVMSFTWWFTNRLTHECCVDENQIAGEVGILTGAARAWQNKFKRGDTSAPKKVDMPEITIEPIDPTEFAGRAKKKPKVEYTADTRLSRKHPGMSIFYFSIPVMIAFAVGVRALRAGGPMMVDLGRVYLGLYSFSALCLLMLTSLGGIRQYFRSRRIEVPKGLGPFWAGLGLIMVLIVLVGATALPLPEMPAMFYVDPESHERDPYVRGVTRYKYSSFAAPVTDVVRDSRVVEYAGYVVLGALALFMLYGAMRGLGNAAAAIARDRDRWPDWVIRFFDRLDAILERMAKLPTLPKLRRAPRVSRDIATCVHFQNTLSTVQGDRMSAAQHIEYAYDALCALAEDLGVPRKPDETPYEYIQAFPERLQMLGDEAYELTELYVLSAYSPKEYDASVEDRLRKFWIAYERLRSRAIK
jgi:hypothetical protein